MFIYYFVVSYITSKNFKSIGPSPEQQGSPGTPIQLRSWERTCWSLLSLNQERYRWSHCCSTDVLCSWPLRAESVFTQGISTPWRTSDILINNWVRVLPSVNDEMPLLPSILPHSALFSRYENEIFTINQSREKCQHIWLDFCQYNAEQEKLLFYCTSW